MFVFEQLQVVNGEMTGWYGSGPNGAPSKKRRFAMDSPNGQASKRRAPASNEDICDL